MWSFNMEILIFVVLLIVWFIFRKVVSKAVDGANDKVNVMLASVANANTIELAEMKMPTEEQQKKAVENVALIKSMSNRWK